MKEHFLFKLLAFSSDGGEARDRVDIDSSNAACVNAGDTDTVGAEVADEAGFKGDEVVECMDSDVVHISQVLESNRDSNEKGFDQHERLPGRSGSSH